MSRNVTGHTGLLCLLGNPVKHSISPAIHNEACRLLDLDYSYLAFNVNPLHLESAVLGLKTIGARGWNVTMPDKNDMAMLTDELSPAARICGAVNTVVNDGGRLTGHTTDGIGYMRCAQVASCDPIGRRVVQLGAGGAGTAILVQMAMDGAESIAVFNARDSFWSRAEGIVRTLNQVTHCQVKLYDINDKTKLKQCLTDASLLLNTTPVGMSRIPGCLIPSPSYFHEGLTVSDVIYEPRETELLRMAREAGLPTFNGLHMLLYQGAASFALWTGKEMPVEEIRKKFFT